MSSSLRVFFAVSSQMSGNRKQSSTPKAASGKAGQRGNAASAKSSGGGPKKAKQVVFQTIEYGPEDERYMVSYRPYTPEEAMAMHKRFDEKHIASLGSSVRHPNGFMIRPTNVPQRGIVEYIKHIIQAIKVSFPGTYFYAGFEVHQAPSYQEVRRPDGEIVKELVPGLWRYNVWMNDSRFVNLCCGYKIDGTEQTVNDESGLSKVPQFSWDVGRQARKSEIGSWDKEVTGDITYVPDFQMPNVIEMENANIRNDIFVEPIRIITARRGHFLYGSLDERNFENAMLTTKQRQFIEERIMQFAMSDCQIDFGWTKKPKARKGRPQPGEEVEYERVLQVRARFADDLSAYMVSLMNHALPVGNGKLFLMVSKSDAMFRNKDFEHLADVDVKYVVEPGPAPKQYGEMSSKKKKIVEGNEMKRHLLRVENMTIIEYELKDIRAMISEIDRRIEGLKGEAEAIKKEYENLEMTVGLETEMKNRLKEVKYAINREVVQKTGPEKEIAKLEAQYQGYAKDEEKWDEAQRKKDEQKAKEEEQRKKDEEEGFSTPKKRGGRR